MKCFGLPFPCLWQVCFAFLSLSSRSIHHKERPLSPQETLMVQILRPKADGIVPLTGGTLISQNMTRIFSASSVLTRHTYYYIVTTVGLCPCRPFSSIKITALEGRPLSAPTTRTLIRGWSQVPWYCARQPPPGQSMVC